MVPEPTANMGKVLWALPVVICLFMRKLRHREIPPHCPRSTAEGCRASVSKMTLELLVEDETFARYNPKSGTH